MKTARKEDIVNLIALIVSSILFILATVLNYYMREGLYLLGMNMIYKMQDVSGGLLNFIENIFSMLGNPIVIYAIIGVQYLYVKQRIRTIVHLTYLMIGLYFMVVLKQAFQESRPFWFNTNIKILEWFCPTDFGNPSGHSFIAFAMYEPLLSDFLGTGKQRLYLFVWGFIAVLVVISRMYLGAHSFDQVVYGSLIGLSFLVIYRFWLQEFLYDTYRELLNQKDRLITGIITAALWVIFLIVPIVIYQMNLEQRPVNTTSVDNINSKCSFSKTSE
jgi:membrane-associated phospholipid phosphatase